MSYMWNRLGAERCDKCNQKIKVGELVMHRRPYRHDKCLEGIKISDLGRAMVIMGKWASFETVSTEDLVKAAKDMIAFFEAEEANK